MTTLDLDQLVRDAGTAIKYKGANGRAFDTPREAAVSLAAEALESRWRDLPSIRSYYQCRSYQYQAQAPVSMGEVLSLVKEDPTLFEDMIKLARFAPGRGPSVIPPVYDSRRWTG